MQQEQCRGAEHVLVRNRKDLDVAIVPITRGGLSIDHEVWFKYKSINFLE